MVDVPEPEEGWESAVVLMGRGGNPASQNSLWWHAAGHFRAVARLSAPLDALAHRLRLTIERSWDTLGEVSLALFEIQRIHFGLVTLDTDADPRVLVFVGLDHPDYVSALEILREALGIGPEAVEICPEDIRTKRKQ